MKYHGKKYLYNFLKEHGYAVPARKETEYRFHRGTEWLRGELPEGDKLVHIEARSDDIYRNSGSEVIYITVQVTEEIEDIAKKTQAEYSKYVNGVLDYQTKGSKITVCRGLLQA